MDIYYYDVDKLDTIASNCKYLSYKKRTKTEGGIPGISCINCSNWNGRSCARKEFDNIAAELHMD